MVCRISCSSQTFVLLGLLIMFGCPSVFSRRRRGKTLINYADCGTGDSKIIHFHTVKATPIPVDVPGTLYLSLAGNVTSDLPRRVNVYLGVTKYILGIPVTVPCFSNGVGSCSYENICASLDHYEKHGCPPALRHYGVPCYCPFTAGEFDLSNVPINIPKIEGFATNFLSGNYDLKVQVVEEDGPVLGCLRLKFTMKQRSRGWLFKI